MIKLVPYSLVLSSNEDDKFTCELKYEASILKEEPIAPSIDHPT